MATADSGCGKSTLRRLKEELLSDEYIILYLSDSKQALRWLYSGLLEQLGLESGFYRGDSKRKLRTEIEVLRGVQKKKPSVYWMRRTSWRRRRWKNSGSC
ncbi:MAG: hypothetical protein LIP11_17715 [Clostridiales bacterium]|nr:hypothetical protein [Clostridiales bacterium]